MCPGSKIPEACPEVYVDDSLRAEKQVEITDDFGGRIYMSKAQLSSFVDKAKNGDLDV